MAIAYGVIGLLVGLFVSGRYSLHVKDSLHMLGSLADSEMPSLPIAFHSEEEKFEGV